MHGWTSLEYRCITVCGFPYVISLGSLTSQYSDAHHKQENLEDAKLCCPLRAVDTTTLKSG